MLDYTARIQFSAPELSGGEFRRLRTQLSDSLSANDDASEFSFEARARTVGATLRITAGSSTRAQAIAEATGRRLLQRVRYVRLSRVRLNVQIWLRMPRESLGGPAGAGSVQVSTGQVNAARVNAARVNA